MEFKDYYQVLGLDKNASEAEIKKSYRKLARKYHPDVSKEADAELRMKEVNEAYAVLGDLEKRAAYDQLGGRYRDGQEFQPPPNWDAGFEFSGAGFSAADMGDFSEFFANLFGQAAAGQAGRGGRAGPRPRRGEDHHAKIVIDLRDAYQGAPRTVTLRAARTDAEGRVSMQEYSLSVQIPKGIKEGQHIRLAGQGGPGSGGSAAGDLFLEVHFKQDPHYRVDGRDVYLSLPVTPWEAALGASVEAPTPSGKVQVKIPANSQSGRKLRLKGRGIPGEPAGDLYLLLEIALPPADTDKARQLYEMMAREMAFNPRLAMGV
ncbi:DnaJ C-terminal domain-containing protein [Pseudomonas borbori]|uniref:Curved DNA-binding protein n=1 Tax=Pseudomonas borbori TaxID=289003 RepID=A0A1I5KGZ5_9PSED|nr:DnaJ C-terminal domain-containing protein [Pseudomonas borbori]SFO84290.1 curved DNA-binding protein [Pseudomonas borbori]